MFFRRSSLAIALAATLLILTSSCRKPEFTHRVAVLRFENLTPDAETDWIGRAASEEIAGQLEGTRHNAIVPIATLRQFENAMGARPVNAPGVSAERAAAIAAGATRIVSGFYTYQNARLQITAMEENVETRKEGAPLSYGGSLDDVLHLTDEIARAIDEEARPPITGSARALRSYAVGLESPAGGARASWREAIGLDPE